MRLDAIANKRSTEPAVLVFEYMAAPPAKAGRPIRTTSDDSP